MRIGVYLRVSTQDQNTDLQIKEIQTYLKARNWSDYAIYEDKASGTHSNRPQLKQLLSDTRQRKLDVVICWKLDRFFRSLKDLVITLQELGELGVSFISLRDQVDLSTSSGRLMLHMLGAFAEFEASLIRERVKAGIAAAKAKGKRLGRPSRVDPALILRLRSTGKSLSEIGKEVGLTKSGVHKILSKLASTNSLKNIETIEEPNL